MLNDMRQGLVEKCNRLTPLSSRSEQEDYLKSLMHYRRVFQTYVAIHSEELHKAIEKAHTNVIMLDKVDG